MSDAHKSPRILINFEWVGMGFCFFVVFHLLPSYFFGLLSFSRDLMIIWVYSGLAFISCYIAYRSRGFTIFEPAIAGTLYLIVLAYSIPYLVEQQWKTRGLKPLVWLMAAFVTSSISAYLGEKIQEWKKRSSLGKQPANR